MIKTASNGLPLVSIITPSYQQAAYLRVCIDSVLGQNYPEIEYRVHDGGSTDGSIEILKSYGSRVTWISTRDRGQADAINAGLCQTKGEIVCFLNSDDWLAPGAVSAAVSALQNNPECDVVYGRLTMTDATGAPVREFPTQTFDSEIFIEHCFIGQPAAFWRRSLHDRFGCFSTEFDHALDYEFWIRIMCGRVRFCYMDQHIAFAREHRDAKSQRLRGEIFKQIIKLQLRHLGYCGRNWWEQYLRYLRDEKKGLWGCLPGSAGTRLYRLAWWPYVIFRSRLGGPLFYRSGHWRA